MAETLIVIQQGTPVVVEEAITFIGAGSAGDPDACRRMVYPASVSSLLAPIVYSAGATCHNPTRTLNLDNVVLTHPITQTVRTLGTTKVLRFEQVLGDVVCTEIWDGSDREASMTTSMLRLFIEYFYNPPPVNQSVPAYIQWEPRDRTTEVYDIELLSVTVGGNQGESPFDIADLRDRGGLYRGGSIENALDGLSPMPTGLVDREVRVRFKIVGVAA